MELRDLLTVAVSQEASDLFLKSGKNPTLRVNGRVAPTDLPEIPASDVRRIISSLMTPDQLRAFETHREMDLAFDISGLCRVRANAYQERGRWAAVFRIVPFEIRTIEELSLPPVLKSFTEHRQGLVLITGPTGCGKSTTLAAMVNLINQTRHCNIVTIEDPIEFIYEEKLAIISQREVNIDTESFTTALRHVVRQSPDVILIGEMRDTETMIVALQASETGHLVLSTVHTSSAWETLDRVMSMFPPHERQQVCQRLAGALRGIVSQKLIARTDGQGRLPACEVLVATPTVTKLIQEQKPGELHNIMAEDRFYGMQTFNQCLAGFVKKGIITEEEALYASPGRTELKQILRHS
jgi:twitching motility protein PilT